MDISQRTTQEQMVQMDAVGDLHRLHAVPNIGFEQGSWNGLVGRDGRDDAAPGAKQSLSLIPYPLRARCMVVVFFGLT
ncbi:hypothetical protein [Streptomyces sp. R08]|uniref:Uncharacterized protein n=1 Tax=Streptomyces sp. R08 TaxID=3238624 RepID=A0AB39MCW7_9ACTN